MTRPLGRTYPELWCTGPDQRRHDQYYAWLKHRAQANFRDEIHLLTFTQWCEFWNKDWAWENRGRRSQDVVLTRIDGQGPWHVNNCEIASRKLVLQRTNAGRTGIPRGPYGPRRRV
jgi:hypothetical protein